MSSAIQYRNLQSRLLLRKPMELQFPIPLDSAAPPLVEGVMRWYERALLRVDTRDIQVDRPIFLVGIPRSGTTMLQDIFCAHPQIAYMTHTMHRYRRVFCAAEDLRKRFRLDARGERYLADGVEVGPGTACEGFLFLMEWLGMDPYSLEWVPFRPEETPPERLEFLREGVRRMLWCFGGGSRRFFMKNPGFVSYMPAISAAFPDAKFIHIVRDPRNCANSMLKLYRRTRDQEVKVRARLGLGDPPELRFVPYPRLPQLAEYVATYGADDLRTTAHVWDSSISIVEADKEHVDNFYEVRYEDIVARPKVEIGKLLEFCELPPVTDPDSPFCELVGQIRDMAGANQYANFDVVEDICQTKMQRYGYL
jgi:hypothetical protein